MTVPITLKTKTPGSVLVKECGRISVTDYTLTAESQTYEMECGEEEGSEVRVQVVDTMAPLMIAEIEVLSYKPSEFQDFVVT